MSATKIEWCDATWSPVTGCTPVSAGCQNCYAKRMANRLRGRYGYPRDDPFKVTLHKDRLPQPSHWRKPRRIFVCSMGDLFHEDVPFFDILPIYDTMIYHEQHTYIILTKRPVRMETFFYVNGNIVPRNVWIGVSVENQKQANERIPILLQIPAAVRFVSVEPMLEPVSLLNEWGAYQDGNNGPIRKTWLDGLDWVVCGAETGPGKRHMEDVWAESVRRECSRAGVQFFFKKDSDGRHELFGKTWEQFPNQEIE